MTHCPCCGAMTAEPVLVDLSTNTVTAGAVSMAFTAREAELLFILAGAFPAALHTDRIITLMWGGEEPDEAIVSLRVYMMRLRRKLAAAGLGIETHTSVGYRLAGQPAAALASKSPARRRRVSA